VWGNDLITFKFTGERKEGVQEDLKKGTRPPPGRWLVLGKHKMGREGGPKHLDLPTSVAFPSVLGRSEDKEARTSITIHGIAREPDILERERQASGNRNERQEENPPLGHKSKYSSTKVYRRTNSRRESQQRGKGGGPFFSGKQKRRKDTEQGKTWVDRPSTCRQRNDVYEKNREKEKE